MMGIYDKPLTLDNGMMFNLPGGLFIVANAGDLERLRASPLVASFGNAAFVPLAADAELPAEIARAAKVLVMEVDPACAESLRRVAKLRTEREDLPIIAALS